MEFFITLHVLTKHNLDAKRRQRDKEGGQTGQMSQKGRADTKKGRADRADIGIHSGFQFLYI